MKQSAEKPDIRCAIYTRKSTDENLDLEYNSLDAQRDSAEAYITSQKTEGWICLPDRYDDGGFTGGNMDRPAMKRLLVDIEDGKIDCVVIYKIDRLSRSLNDFTRMMELLEKHHVSLVAVTQQINTSTSTGRLMLNILSSFAQFERELVSERTRDKIAAARRKGKWSGGHPVLGYDIERSPSGSKLIVNEDEAPVIRQIYDLYLEHRALLPVVRELAIRGWVGKRWTTHAGKPKGGRPFDKVSLYNLLTNVVYLGKVRHKEHVYEGEHLAIVSEKVFTEVQSVLARNGRSGGADIRNKYGALLKGLLYCKPCNSAMSHSYSTKGNRRYRYYRCCQAGKNGHDTCPAPSVPAQQIEQFVVEQIHTIGQDPELVRETIADAVKQSRADMKRLKDEESSLRRQLKRDADDLAKVAADATGNGHASARLADINDRIATSERRLVQVQQEIASMEAGAINEHEATEALRQFDPIWNELKPRDQTRLLRLLIQRVEYDGEAGTVSLTFHPDGFNALTTAEPTEKEIAA